MPDICYNCNSYLTKRAGKWVCPECLDTPGNSGPEPVDRRPDPPPAPPNSDHDTLAVRIEMLHQRLAIAEEKLRDAALAKRVEELERFVERYHADEV